MYCSHDAERSIIGLSLAELGSKLLFFFTRYRYLLLITITCYLLVTNHVLEIMSTDVTSNTFVLYI
jgi:hypothetical protein